MKEIILVRHGDVEYQTDASGRKLLYGPDAHLNEIGKKQMGALAEKLSEKPLDAVYVSPLTRTQESAGFIIEAQRQHHGKRLQLDIRDGIRGLELGEWVGVPVDQIETDPNGWPDFYSHPKPGQEPYEHLYNRVKGATRDIVQNLPSQSVSAIVAHSEINRIVVHVLEHPDASLPKSGNDLPVSGQLQKGEAFLLVLDGENKVIKKERITPF